MLKLVFLGLCPGPLYYPESVCLCMHWGIDGERGRGGGEGMRERRRRRRPEERRERTTTGWKEEATPNLPLTPVPTRTPPPVPHSHFRGELQVGILNERIGWRTALHDQQTPDPRGPHRASSSYGRAAESQCQVKTPPLTSAHQARAEIGRGERDKGRRVGGIEKEGG